MELALKKFGKLMKKIHEKGLVMHTAGWPLDNNTYGGSFVCTMLKTSKFF